MIEAARERQEETIRMAEKLPAPKSEAPAAKPPANPPQARPSARTKGAESKAAVKDDAPSKAAPAPSPQSARKPPVAAKYIPAKAGSKVRTPEKPAETQSREEAPSPESTEDESPGLRQVVIPRDWREREAAEEERFERKVIHLTKMAVAFLVCLFIGYFGVRYVLKEKAKEKPPAADAKKDSGRPAPR
jgi:hypothetical protein